METKSSLSIGGFINISISQDSCDYLCDEDAMLFSLSKNENFSINKSSASKAIFMPNNYLLCFGNDLMIAKEGSKDCSECNWPDSYEIGLSNQEKKIKGSMWLTGEDHHFGIKTI